MNEGEVLGTYVLGRTPNRKSMMLYEEAMRELHLALDTKEENLMRFMMEHQSAVQWIDSGLALFKKQSSVRKRILVMSAILETQPEYADLFFPERASIVSILWRGFCAGCKGIIGGLMISFI